MGRVQRNVMFLWVSLVLVTLAGCAEAPTEAVDDTDFDEFQLAADEDTGVIRGIVVDETIKPVADAVIQLDADQSATSNADGAFGFSGVTPGVHRLTVDATGFTATTTTVQVDAGVDEPQIVKVLLAADASELPYVDIFQFSGYIQCSFSTPAYRVAACSVAATPVSTDDFLAGFDIGLEPEFVQAEMLWDSTQPLGEELQLVVEVDPLDGNDIGAAHGPSPLVLPGDREAIERSGMNRSAYLQERVFNYEHSATTPPVPVCDVPNPIHGGTMCVKGVGMTLEQPFEIFTHVFYRFAPPEGWQFSVDGTPAPPS